MLYACSIAEKIGLSVNSQRPSFPEALGSDGVGLVKKMQILIHLCFPLCFDKILTNLEQALLRLENTVKNLHLLLFITALLMCFQNYVFSDNDPVPPSPVLGWGWSNDNSLATGMNCLNLPLKPVFSGSSSGIVESKNLTDLQDIEDQLNIYADGHTGIGLFSATDSAHFMQYIENDNLSETFIYRTTLSFKDANAAPRAVFGSFLNVMGKEQWKAGPATFRQACGDSFVSQIHYGAYLYIAYQFHFLNQVDKREFDSAFTSSTENLENFNTALETKAASLHIQGNLHIVAYQKGGDPTVLSNIFQSTNPFDPTATSRCPLSDLSDCEKVMQNIAVYASDGINGFPSQLKITPDQEVPQLAADVANTSVDYSKLDPEYVTKSLLTSDIISARDGLGSLYNNQNSMLQRANYLTTAIQMYPYVYDDFMATLKSDITTLISNVDILREAGYNCFQNLDQCIDGYNSAKASLGRVNQSDFTLPEQIKVSETNGFGTVINNIFVAKQAGSNPTAFIGAQYQPTVGPFTVQVLNDAPNIKIIKQDSYGSIIAVYDGVLEDNQGDYKGTVSYPSTHAPDGTWTGQVLQNSNYENK